MSEAVFWFVVDCFVHIARQLGEEHRNKTQQGTPADLPITTCRPVRPEIHLANAQHHVDKITYQLNNVTMHTQTNKQKNLADGIRGHNTTSGTNVTLPLELKIIM